MAVYGVFEDSGLGLDTRGYKLVPNDVLLTRICIYSREIVETVLMKKKKMAYLFYNLCLVTTLYE
jgi:hypothetical protein